MSHDPNGRDTIVRYTAAERTNHWIVAISFVLAALSGTGAVSSGAVLAERTFRRRPVDPHPASVHRRSSWSWRSSSWSTARVAATTACSRGTGSGCGRWRDVVNNREEDLPEVGRYNAGQKLLFFLMVLCLAGLFLSGIVIWRAYFASVLLRGHDPRRLGMFTRCAPSC